MQINENWEYQQFDTLFDWCEKSKIGSRQGTENGKYPLYIASATEIKRYNEYLVEGESIVFGTGGNPCIHYVDGKFSYTNHTEAAQKKNNEILTKFYFYYFQCDRYRQLQSTFVGGGIKNSSKKKIGQLLVPVPPLPEQQRIVAKIEELFTELDNSLAMLKNVKEQLEVYSKSIYSHFILPNIEKVMVKDICNEIHIGPFGSALHKADYVINGVPVINPSNIKNQQIIPDSRLSVTEKKAQELSSYKLQVGDIIMGRRGEMGRCAPVTKKENGYICGTGSLFFRLKPEYDNVLYSQILASQEVVSFLMEKAVGTTMKNLNEDIVSRILVPKITKSAGNKILEIMQDVTNKCNDISCRLNQMEQQADALRQSILKKAFEGEL